MSDNHAEARDRKRSSRDKSRRMRGNRSVFVMAAAQAKRDAAKAGR